MNLLGNIKMKLLLIVAVLTTVIAQAQDIPFNCDYNAYLFQYNDVYAIDLASGNSYQVAQDITPGNINAAAYNPADGFIWGSLSSPAKSIVRIGKNFTTTTFYVDELPSNNRYVGDINDNGIYFLKGGGTTYYKIDLNPDSANYTLHEATETLSQNINIHDWAFNAVDSQLYTVEKNSNILYRINPSNGMVQAIGEVPILSGLNYTYGAVYFDADGRFYVSANQTGTIYVIQNVQNLTESTSIDSNLFAFGPSSASNDGARCPTAPVPQEICDNGIDDDGDGLIDCEDPSCSGFGECAVIEAPTSGGNAGGLESNNRLSEQINKRNFNRVKSGYKFDMQMARRIQRTDSYLFRNASNTFGLEDFIPLDVLNEDEVIESTPEDLINITNASEIYAVDYLKEGTPVASILALKTENGVYEHTKYICDRLLGAELISVSTIAINDQQFIKAIIKNVDGSFEYVLSFSAKPENNDEHFAIDSHWNLDQYEPNATYYNFQIWTNSVDDLFQLGQEVLQLLDVEKPIVSYNNSTPPTVFVRKGKYTNGALDLQIVNTNATESVTFDAGFRATETSAFSNTSSSIDLNGQYITNLQVDTGNLFDIGFRIGDGIATPDDLFMSDGPWGIDDSQQNSMVTTYSITENTSEFDLSEFPIERNLSLTGTTSTYLAAYRALTPRFKAVNLSSFNSLKFQTEGTGTLEITLVKESVTNWENQMKAYVNLSNTLEDVVIPISSFQNLSGYTAPLDDIVTIVFTLVSDSGMVETKSLEIKQLRFSEDEVLSIEEEDASRLSLVAIPNPITSQTHLHVTAKYNETVQLVVYNQLGSPVYQSSAYINAGSNKLPLELNLSSGIYVLQIVSQHNLYKSLKILAR
ncbi:DUF6923 family protein [Psychroserpens sp. S379A]|uniref:DUF6923 family protein n=1 Tax=Psychroserpens sp. S379A TaxID=3415137 RepID=UPI003C7A9287